MTLTLDLSPAQERNLETLARIEGIPHNELALQLLADALSQKNISAPLPDEVNDTFVEPDEIKAESRSLQQIARYMDTAALAQVAQRAAVLDYINAPAEEIAHLHAPEIARLQAEIAEAERATPEEIAQADAEWEEHKRRINANRALTGERPLFADVLPLSR